MIEVHENLKARYDDMTADFAIGDYKELNEKVIVFTLDNGKSLRGMRGEDYFRWVCVDPDVPSHKVFGIDNYEKYREQFEGKGADGNNG